MEISMTEKLIIYFIYKTKSINREELVMYLYLMDLGTVVWKDEQLTDISWRYSLGKLYGEEIHEILDNLYQANILKEEEGLIKVGVECLNPRELNLPRGIELRIDNIYREWKDRDNELLEYVYGSEPIKSREGKEGEIRLDLYLERDKMIKLLGI